MRKGLFGLNGFASVVVFIVALALIAAIVVFSTVGSVITVDPVQAPAEAAVTSSLVHGSVTSETTSGTAISSSTDFYNNIITGSQSGTYYLNADFELSASHMFAHTSTFTGTLYGNGHTITILSGYKARRKAEKNGILFSQLAGRVQDLNVVVGNGNPLGIHIGEENVGYYGIIAGALAGGTVSNCRVVVNPNTVFHAVTTSSAASSLSTAGIGAIAGEVWGSNSTSTITNCTVENNGSIICTAYSGTYDNYDAGLRQGYAGNLVGLFWAGDSNTFNINNVIIRGNGVVHAHCVGLIGCTPSGYTSALTIKNYLNDFKGSYEITGAGPKYASSVIFFYNYGSHTVTNYYSTSGAKTGWAHHDTEATISGRIAEIPSKFSVYFDASQTVDNSLAIVCEASTPPAGYERTYTLTAQNGSSWTTKDIVDGKVIFTGLPTAAGTWTSGGNFSATLDYTDTKLPTLDPLTEYEHGYYAGSTPSGTGLNSTQFFNTFVNKNSTNAHNGSGTYYLTEDAYITGFTGRDFRGTLDGNGKTVYIVGAQTGLEGDSIGGIIGELNGGTVKNLRVVICVDVNVQTSGTVPANYKTVGIGGVVGNITGNALIENVNVVINKGVTFSTSNNTANAISIGGISGNIFGKGRLNNCTVQLDGTMSCTAGYAFISGIVGNTGTPNHTSYVSGQDHPYMYSNIVLKGGGQFTGKSTQDTSEPMFSAALTITDNKSSAAQISIDGFIYALTNSDVVNATISCYGYVSQNKASGGVSSSTAGGLSTDGYITYDNVFTASGCTMTPEYSGHNGGNNSFAITTTAAIPVKVEGDNGIDVMPYFKPQSTSNLTLVANTSSATLKLKDSSTTVATSLNGVKTLDVAKSSATFTLIKPASVPQITGSYTYTGSEITPQVNVTYNGTALNPSNYSLSYGSIIYVGNYDVTTTLLNGYYFYNNNTVSFGYTSSLYVA